MKAAYVSGRDVLTLADAQMPEAGPKDLVVRVRAAALNRADLGMLALGLAAGAIPYVAGREFAGEVTAVGPEAAATGFRAGDGVMAYGIGAFAEFTCLDHRLAMRVPRGLDWHQAAASPLGLQTMHDALITHGRLAKGESVLVHGASSGMGIQALRMAKALGAGMVIGSSRSETKLQALEKLGMDAGVNLADPAWPMQVRELTGERGADIVIDMVTGDTVAGSLAAAAVLGRIVNVGRLGGSAGKFNFDVHALNRLTYVGVTFRTRTNDEIQELIARSERDLGARMGDGSLAIPIDRVFSLAQVVEAHDYMRSNAHLGKIVIEP